MLNTAEAIAAVRKYTEEMGGVELSNYCDDFCEIIRDEEMSFESEEVLLEKFREFALVD